MDAVPTSFKLADLNRKITTIEDRLGVPQAPESGEARPAPPQPVAACLATLSSDTEALFAQDEQIATYEKNLAQLDTWLKEQYVADSGVVLHANAKRNYVLQHQAELTSYRDNFEELKALEEFKSPACLAQLPDQGERLQTVGSRGAAACGAAIQLHSQITNLAEEYHKTVTALNAQMLEWDCVLADFE